MVIKSLLRFSKIKEFFLREYFWFTPPLVFLSFPSFDIFFMKLFPLWAWFSLAPLFSYIKGRPLKEVYLKTFAAGLIANYMSHSWIGEFGAKVPGGSVVILACLIPTLSVFFAVKVILGEYLSRKYEPLRFLIMPSAWILIDWVQSIGFLAFPWTYWGYSQYPFVPFIQLSSITGIYGITFFLIASSTLASGVLDLFIKNKINFRGLVKTPEFKKIAVFGIVVMLITAGGFISLMTGGSRDDNPSAKKLKIAMIQSCISPWDSWGMNKYKYLGELTRYTDMALAENPDFIIWSESATLETIYYNYVNGRPNQFQIQLLDYVKRINKPLLTGEIGLREKIDPPYVRVEPLNNAVLISAEGVPVETYSKINLVPIGEWFPYEKWLPIVKRIADSFGASSFIPGNKPEIFTLNGFRFGALICYEGIFHRLCREYRLMNADFLINITNDGWTDTYSGHMQHFSASVFRAVENGTWVLRAGNTGYTAVIDPQGRIVKSIPILRQGYLNGEIDASQNRNTFYTMAGDLIIYASALFIAVLLVILFKRRYAG